jgi:energy-coupling factor transporter transmembrane protein EcfT
MVWPIIYIAAILLTIYIAWRKGLASLPLALGLWLLIAVAQLLLYWFPPLPWQIAVVFFLGGVAITLIVWGLYNYYINAKFKEIKPFHVDLPTKDGVKFYVGMDVLGVKPPYAVMYGLIPWDASGAKVLVDFLNEKVWGQGLALRMFEAEHAVIGGEGAGIHVAYIFGIVTPKNILDRILY